MSNWFKLSDLAGSRVVEVTCRISEELGDPTLKILKVLLEDGRELSVEGEHDFPYIAEDLDLPEVPNEDE